MRAKRYFSNVLVTGAGSGIGQSFCRLLRQQGIRVWAVDRFLQDEPLSSGANVTADVNDSDLIQQLIASWPKAASSSSSACLREPFDLVVHCAGTSAVGRFENVDGEPMEILLETNLSAPMRITRDLTRAALLAPDATQVFVASLSCFLGYPGASAYAASKDGLWAFSRCLAESVRPAGGHVLTVFPGPTDTPHATRYSHDNSRKHRRMCPDTLADRIWRAAGRDRAVLFGRSSEAVAAWVAYVLPHAATRLMGMCMRSNLPANQQGGLHER